jgi:nucleoside-diphosphate-sugar epimerase
MRALVVGGTGPSGPHVVDGLLDRGYEVTVFHSGRHEVPFAGPVEHLHGDAHFADGIADCLGDRTFDLVVGMYGRLRLVADWAAGRTDMFLGVTGTAGYAERDDPRWGALGRELLPDESGPWLLGPRVAAFQYKIHQAEEHVLTLHRRGAFTGCVLRPPNMYGPRQIGPEDWAIVRRILDGRRRLIVPDGGLKIDARVHVRNFAAAVLCLVDSPEGAAGRRFNVRDQTLYSMRQRVALIADTLGATIEQVPMPFEFAKPSHPCWRWSGVHRAVDDSAIRALGHTDALTAAEGIQDAVRWLVDHRPAPDGEEERQLGDPFDYATEDRLLAAWDGLTATLADVEYPLPVVAHRYRHPTAREQEWSRPLDSSYDPGV